MKRSLPVWVAAVVSASVLLTASPAMAQSGSPNPPAPAAPQVLRDGLVSPLKLALDWRGSVYVSQSFVGTLHRLDRNGEFTTLYTSPTPGTELAGVSRTLWSTLFTERLGTTETVVSSQLKSIDRGGEVSTIADLLAFETAQNPDGAQRYGFVDLPAECAAQLPPGLPATYTGLVDSHAYATLPTLTGTIVADAGANALLHVDHRGRVSTLAVLPAQRASVAEWPPELGAPACAAGRSYDFEPVPTDVEWGADGALYVTLLPGGPEGPGAGARASVVRVNPWTGESTTVATGLTSATDLAVSPGGDVYVAELFAGRISVIPRGSNTPRLFREVAAPAAVEWSPLGLYATIDALGQDETAPPAGKVVLLRF